MTNNHRQVLSISASAAAILLVAALIIVFNGGISVGLSNHAGLLPVVRRILDNDYLPGDFGIAVRFYHHRVFAYLVAGFSAVLGEDNALIALTVLGMTLMSAALFILCRTLNLGLFGYVAVGLFLATKLGWTGLGLESNNFAGNADIMPTTFAHSFLLLATASVVRQRFRIAGFFAGLVLLIHLQIGIIGAIVLFPFFVARMKSIKPTESALWPLIFLVPGSLGLIQLIQMLQAGLADSPFTLDYINFRHPHHFELLPPEAAVWVTIHLGIQIAVDYWLRRKQHPEARGVRVLLTMSLMIAGLSALHFLDYYVLQFGFIAKIQLLRLSPLITVYGTISLVVAVGAWEKGRVTASRPVRAWRPAYVCLIALGAIWTGYYLMARPYDYYFGVRKYAEQKSSWANLCVWIRKHGPPGIYLTPPDRGGFTYLTNRSTVVEFKINPDGALHLEEWYQRLRDVCGGTLPSARGFDNYPLLRKAYGSLTYDQLSALAAKYGAGYAVVPTSSQLKFETLYQNDGYRLVSIEKGVEN
jgi:hypothetical protein